MSEQIRLTEAEREALGQAMLRHATGGGDGVVRAAVERIVADRVAQAKAEALREAAAEIDRTDETCGVQRTCHMADALLLRTRADRIEADHA